MKQLLLDWLGQAAPQPFSSPNAIPTPVSAPTSVDTSAPWQHPKASHRITLDTHLVAYRLQRSRRRSIGMRITAQGLDVRAPGWTPLAEIETVLQRKTRWLLSKLHEAQAQPEAAAPPPTAWHDGAQLRYLGGPLTLRISPAHSPAPPGGHLDETSQDQPLLWLNLPASTTDATQAAHLEAAAQAWLQRQCIRVFTARLDHFAPQMGVRWQRLSVSRARTRWGSASTDGSIRLNHQLIHLPLALIDYVVVHELAHLHEMNHSPRFWAHVERVLPDWAERRKALRCVALPG